MGYGITFRTYHVPVVRGPVTKKIEANIALMLGEMRQSFESLIGMPLGTHRPRCEAPSPR